MKKILVVEDSKLISQAIKLLFEGKGYKVHQQDDGSRVLDDVKKNAIDLVILDLMMPKMPGEKVFSVLKADPATKDVKILVLTAKTDALTWDAQLSGCDKMMPKPFRNEELLREVERLIGR